MYIDFEVEKVVLKYGSGGFGPITMFYSEKLTIQPNKIAYSKKWESNTIKDKECAFEEFFFDEDIAKRNDMRWEITNPFIGYKDVLEEVADILLCIFDSEQQAFVCDGPSLIAEVILKNGKKRSMDIACFENVYRGIRKALKKVIPSDLLFPEFLQETNYEEEE